MMIITIIMIIIIIIIIIKGCCIQIKHNTREDYKGEKIHIYVEVFFFSLSKLIFIFPLFLGMVILLMNLKQRKNKN